MAATTATPAGAYAAGSAPEAAVGELLALAAETACEAVRARDAVLALRDAAGSMSGQAPPNSAAIRQVAKAYGIPVRHRKMRHIVLNLADALLDDISCARPGAAGKTIRTFAPERDFRDWESRGVLPVGAYHEAARSAFVARRLAGDTGAVAAQLERCALALAYPASLVGSIARAALAGDTAPMLGAFQQAAHWQPAHGQSTR